MQRPQQSGTMQVAATSICMGFLTTPLACIKTIKFQHTINFYPYPRRKKKKLVMKIRESKCSFSKNNGGFITQFFSKIRAKIIKGFLPLPLWIQNKTQIVHSLPFFRDKYFLICAKD